MDRCRWFADEVIEPGERADLGADDGAPWMAFVQLNGTCHALHGAWFASKADCERFICDELAGLPVLDAG